jgi:hypothetical protein
MYTSIKNDDYMPDKLILPRDEPLIFKKHQYALETLLSIVKYPWVYSSGGAKGKRKKAVNTHRESNRPVTDAPFHEAFCDKWTSLRIKGLKSIGVLDRDGQIHWSVSVAKGRPKMGEKSMALHYRTPVHQDPFEYEIALWREFMTRYNHCIS